MSDGDKYFKVFKQATDHNKWNKQIEFASVMDGIEETSRAEFISALVFLEKELGRGFLKTSSVNHPIRQKVSNKAEWQTQELIRFADTLQKLKAIHSNYRKLVRKLLAYESAESEGIPFVEIAESFLKEKLQVRFPNETHFGKSPDIEIINPKNNDKFFIEVSVVNNSAERNLISKNYYFLQQQFHLVPPVYLFTGKQKEKISGENYSEIKRLITEAKKQVEETNEIASFSDERLEFSVAPFEKVEELDKICLQNRTRRNDVSGLPMEFDETDRLINNKIKIEAKQIPADSNGILYFPLNPLFFMFTDVASSVFRLQDYISRFTNILGIVLYSKVLNPQQESFAEVAKHIFRRKVFDGVLCQELLFVYNHNCNVKIADETMKKIYSTFRK